jgi:uncharacterized protein YdeI (YjbR/CyaY-like superfamily)
MGQADRRIDVFMQKAERWQGELMALRAILLDGPLDEAFKWRQPVYTCGGKNVAILWGFKEYCGIGFFKGVLMKDPENILVAQGEHSRATRLIRVSSVGEIESMEATLKDYIAEAVAVEKAGLKVDLPKDDLEWPEELVARLDDDPELREAFEALTPGRRRGYVLHISQAKQSETRAARIEKWAPRILEGKGMHDR